MRLEELIKQKKAQIGLLEADVRGLEQQKASFERIVAEPPAGNAAGVLKKLVDGALNRLDTIEKADANLENRLDAVEKTMQAAFQRAAERVNTIQAILNRLEGLEKDLKAAREHSTGLQTRIERMETANTYEQYRRPQMAQYQQAQVPRSSSAVWGTSATGLPPNPTPLAKKFLDENQRLRDALRQCRDLCPRHGIKGVVDRALSDQP